MNKEIFYKIIRERLFHNIMKQSQVDGIEYLLIGIKNANITDKRWCAYMLATAFHETAATMQPIEEYGKGRNYKYGQKIKRSGIVYTAPDKIYYGRGYVQLTWFENYELMGRLLGIDLLNQPELALRPEIATKIMLEGMIKGASSIGDFTGRCLEMYFNEKTTDWVNARRIINGLDKAEKIAEDAKSFFEALNQSIQLAV